MPTPSMPHCATPRCLVDARARLGEGTWWSVQAQTLWWVDILSCRLFAYTPASARERDWRFDEEISAVAERADAPGLLVTLRRGFATFDPDSGEPARYLHRPEEPTGNRFNDGKCDAAGRFWGGTMDFDGKLPSGAFHVYAADGSCVRQPVGFAITNGPTWSLDQRTLYINDTARRRVFAFDHDPATGRIANRREWLRFAREDGHPDGMTTDAAGRLWIAHWGAGCVSCHDPVSGDELGRVTFPASQITDCAFGGPDLRTLFVTSAREGLTAEQLVREPLAGALFGVAVAEPGLAPTRFGDRASLGIRT